MRSTWDHRFDALSEYNSLKMRASGAMFSTLDTPELRALHQRDAQELLNALDQEYVVRMEHLQHEYDDTRRRSG